MCCNFPDGNRVPLKVRSMVGLIPLFAVEVLDDCVFRHMPEFTRRLRWFLDYRPDLAALVSRWNDPNSEERHLLSLLRGHRVKRLLARMLDESEFLSEYGVRAVSKRHEHEPFVFEHQGDRFSVGYVPGESLNERLRRQLELARPDLDAGQLSADRVAAPLSPLLRRRVQGRMPDRLRTHT